MKKDAKTFQKVAERCTQFNAGEYNAASNSTGENSGNISCKNCTHYEPSKVCSLNLYSI